MSRIEEIDQTVDDLINNRAELTNFVNDYFILVDRVEELETGINKTLSRMEKGGAGTRSRVNDYLEEALKGEPE